MVSGFDMLMGFLRALRRSVASYRVGLAARASTFGKIISDQSTGAWRSLMSPSDQFYVPRQSCSVHGKKSIKRILGNSGTVRSCVMRLLA